MGETIMITNSCQGEIAVYKPQIITDYQNNPFIEALPPVLSAEEVVEKLAFYPEYRSEERYLDSHYRIHMINRLFQVYQPLPMTIELETRISRVLRQGYVSRNPFSAKTAQGFREGYMKLRKRSFCNCNNHQQTASGFTIIGISGLGKTSSLERVLAMYPQVIVHSEYKGIPFSMYQVVWLKLECPHDGSLKGLLFDFFSAVDRLLGTSYYDKMVRARPTVDVMLSAMYQVARNCSLGLLVIDEIQHLSLAKSGGSEKMLNFFVNIVNNVGVPVILVGTPKALGIIQSEFRQARRGSGIVGDMICDRMQKDKVWELLVNAIWPYQWVRKETALTQEFIDVLYDETQGIPDLLKKLYGMTQVQAIISGQEEISPALIRKVAKENLKLVQPVINALRTGNIREIAKYDDVCVNVDFNSIISKARQATVLDLRAKAVQKSIKEEKQEDLMEKKQKAVLKLIDLGFEARKVQKVVDNLTLDKPDFEVNDIVIQAITIMTGGTKAEKTKRAEKKNNVLDPKDIRRVVEEGKKRGKSAFEALLEFGYIKTFETDIFSTG